MGQIVKKIVDILLFKILKIPTAAQVEIEIEKNVKNSLEMHKRKKIENTFIKVRRFEYEEPYHTEVWVSASNGAFSGEIRYFCVADDLKEIASKLETFSKDPKGEYKYEVGSEDPEDNSGYYFLFRVCPMNSNGQCSIHIRITVNGTCSEPGICEFSIIAEPNHIAELSKFFLDLYEFKVSSFSWNSPVQPSDLMLMWE